MYALKTHAFSIRACRSSDATAIVELENVGGQETWTLQQAVEILHQEHTRAWILDHPSAGVVGHLISTIVADEAEIITMVVHPTHRRCGGARLLMREACSAWDHAGVHAAFLEVRETNQGAIMLYEGSGFVEVGRRRSYYRDGTSALVMRRDAAPSQAT